jgi:hypothetical protein
MDKDVLYRWMAGNGFKRESLIVPQGVVHEWTRHCTQCPLLSFVYTDPGELDAETIDDTYEQALDIVTSCGHVVTV